MHTNHVAPILFVLPGLGMGGSERVVLNLCLHLDRSIFYPVVAAFRDGEIKREMVDAGVPVHVLDRCGGVDIRLILKLIRLLIRYQIRIVNTHHFVSLFYAFWASRFCSVSHIHTEHSRWEMERLSPFWQAWFRFFLKRINLVTAVSKDAYQHLKHTYGLNDHRRALILNGIDTQQFENSKNNSLTKASFGLPDNDFVIGNVGNFRKEKNQEVLIKALATIKYSSHAIRILLVGDGPRRSALKKLASDLGVEDRVIFLGTRKDVPHLYGLFDIYCLPSRYEGLPLTLLEAMAARVPVIGTNVLGIREIIKHRENGLLVPDNDPETLAHAILELINNSSKRKRYVEKARDDVVMCYSITNFVKNYELLFERILFSKDINKNKK